MIEEERPGSLAPPSANVGDLMEDFRRQEETLRVQARELGELRNAVLHAAEREASGILTTARADIRRIILDARHDLLGLSERIRMVTNVERDAHPRELPANERSQLDRLLNARQDVRGILGDAKVDLEPLAEDVRIVSLGARALATQPPPGISPPRKPTTESKSETGEVDMSRLLSAFEGMSLESTSGRSTKVAKAWVASFAASGLVFVFGTAWWMRSGRDTLSSPRPPAVSVKPSTPTPAAKQPAPGVAAPADPPKATTPAALSLRVQAEQAVWMRTTVDGNADAGEILQAGETRQIEAAQEVSLRVGNAGALRVSMNGAAPTIMGPDGVPMTRRFAVSAPSTPPKTEPPARTEGTRSTDRNNAQDRADAAPRIEQKPARAAGPAPAGSPTDAATADPARAELTSTASQWLDAYYRGNPDGIALLTARDVTLSDSRSADQRVPPNLSNVRRTLNDVTFQFSGEAAVLTARMTEQADVAGQARQYVSWVSQVWLRESGKWHLIDVRLVADAKLQ